MNFLSMRYFSAVAKERSFTRAAAHLFITQQTLSTHIAAIEKELGCRLFVRTYPLRLTYEGKVFLQYAMRFDDLHLSMEREFFDLKASEKGLLHIGIAHTRGRALLPDIICAFKAQYPNIVIHIEETTNDALCARLLDKELDLIIASLTDGPPEIEIQPFYVEQFYLLVSKKLLEASFGEPWTALTAAIRNSKDISSLAAVPFLLSGNDDIVGKIGRQLLHDAGFVPHVSVESHNVETLLELCLKGEGACFCPTILFDRLGNAAMKKRLEIFDLGKAACCPIKFAWRRQQYHWKAITDFVTTARKVIEKRTDA